MDDNFSGELDRYSLIDGIQKQDKVKRKYFPIIIEFLDFVGSCA